MKKLLITLGVIFLFFIIFIFAIALQVYNSPHEQAEQNQIVYNQEVEKPLTRLESAERQSVQDWKDEVERKKREATA